jgi:glyoxylase-like metal-dependent hydrolase (beta-lactamase superfamily II)
VVHYHWERLAEGVHRTRLPFLDVTVGLVWGSGGVLLIDTGTTLEDAQRIDDDVYELTQRDVSHIVLTHNHFDHVLGSPAFAGAEIYAAPEVAETITRRTAHLRDDAIRYGAAPGAIDRAVEALRPPDHQTLEAAIDLGDRTAFVSHPGRGHTNHDLIVVVPDHRTVVFCGDLVEESGDPAVGGDSHPAAWPATLDRVVDAGGSDAVYVPGHGAVVEAAFIRRQQDWLRNAFG